MSQKSKVPEMPMVQGRFQIKGLTDSYLQVILDRWRPWSETCCVSGFKKRTIEHQLMIEGVIIKVTGGFEVDDIECEVLDFTIARMPPRMKKAIINKYLFRFKNDDAAKALKISISTYKRYINRCREYLLCNMSGKI